MKINDINWAYTHSPESGYSPTEILQKSATLFIGEVMRSDEVALLMYRKTPIALFRLFEVDFETNDTLVEDIDSPETDWQFLFDDLRAAPGLMVSGFEVLCYRGKNTVKPFLPRSNFKSYTDAKRQTSRILSAVFVHSSIEWI